MSGPNREWKAGDRGPDYHVESMAKMRHGHRWGRPMCWDDHGHPGGVVPPMPAPRRTGRDPHDKLTMELPLPEPAFVPEIVIRLKPMLQAGKELTNEGKEAAGWLCLLHWAAGLESFE